MKIKALSLKSVVTTLLGILAISIFSPLGYAQQTRSYVVVATCGAQSYSVGDIRYATMDTSGSPCGATVTVSLATSGLSSSAKQDTGNTSLGSIDTKLTSGGQKAQQVDASGNVQPAGDSTARPIYVSIAFPVPVSTGAPTISGSSTAVVTASLMFNWNGSNWVPVANTDVVHTIIDSGAVTSAATLTAETTKVIGTVRMLGNGGAVIDFAGQNAASPANAILTGCQFNTSPTTVTSTDSSPLQCDNGARLLVKPVGAGPVVAASAQGMVASFEALTAGGTSSMTGTTSTSVIAGTASQYVYVTSCSVTNTHASVDTLVDLQDGSGGTVLWVFGTVHGYGGESHTFGHPLKVLTSGNGLFAVNETTGSAVKIFCNGFKSTVSY